MIQVISRQLLTIVVRDLNVDKTVKAIMSAAKTGVVGDGKIFVSEIEQSYRIRNEESGSTSPGPAPTKDISMKPPNSLRFFCTCNNINRI